MNYNNANGQLTYQLEIDKQQKNGFPIPCTFKSTGKLGVLYPTQALEVTYGDTINNTSMAGVQFNPLAVPIMANMQIKQEHYYVPFNDVWLNWDNFITGGEELDFTTPPPTISFARIISMLNPLFGNGFGLDYIVVNVTGTPTTSDIWHTAGHYFYVKIPTLPIASTISQYFTKLAIYGMSDLGSHFVTPAINNIQKYFDYYNSIINEFKRTHQPVTYDCHISPEIFYNNEEGSYYVLLGCNKEGRIKTYGDVFVNIFPTDYKDTEEFKNIQNSYNYYRNSINSPISIDFRFTTEGYDFIKRLYKPYQPFVGVGSYLDCLNMGCLTEEHFIYLWYCSFVYAQANESDFILNYDLLSDLQLRALELRALYLIWYNNYRDQLLETSAMKPRRDDTITDDELFVLLMPRVRCWEKDSYTTALDNPATADAVVPVGYHNSVKSYYQSVDTSLSGDDISKSETNLYAIKFNSDNEVLRIPTNFLHGINKGPDVTGSEYLSSTYFSLHVLDAVKRAQRFLRKALFYGNRIQDFIYSNFGVAHLDARLRLPELLATSVVTAELQTLVNNTTVVTEQSATVAGDRAGFAKAFDNGNYFSRFCEESGLIISLFSVMPEPTYAYGQSRQYFKLDRFDYPFPDFATLGMDAVYDNELTALPCKVLHNGKLVANPLVFGYQGRYYDKKFRQSTEHGELLTTQDMYTFGRKWNMFDSYNRPILNAEFVHCFPPLDMFVMEDNTEDYFRYDVFHKTTAELQLPYHSIYL